MQLTNIRPLGRYVNTKTSQAVNLHRGQQVGRGTDVTFFLRQGQRVLISESDLYGGDWKRVSTF